MHWHAAQALALAGAVPAALKHIPPARLDPEPPDSPVRWNDYVAATEAFLQHNRANLIGARERIARKNPDDPTLAIVDSLVTHFGEPIPKHTKRNDTGTAEDAPIGRVCARGQPSQTRIRMAEYSEEKD